MTVQPTSGAKSAVFFDVDGTLVDVTIVHYYAYFRRRGMSPVTGSLWHGSFLLKCLYYLLLDKIDRSLFNIRFYRNYAGMSVEKVTAAAADCYRQVMRPRLFEHATACVDAHRAAGRAVVLLTGSLDFIIQPLADALRADAVIAPSLVAHDGRFTGALNGPPIGDEEKARRLEAFANDNDINLSQCYAYADSLADLPMLQRVGHPNVVNPDKRLARIARDRHWPVHHWQREKTNVSD